MAAIRRPRLLMRTGRVRDGMVATAAGRLAQPQAARTLTTASTSSAFTGSSGRPFGEERAQRGAPADIGEAAERAAGFGGQRGGDFPGCAVHPEVFHAGRPQLARLDLAPGAEQPLPGILSRAFPRAVFSSFPRTGRNPS
jgi:hypothetical protein